MTFEMNRPDHIYDHESGAEYLNLFGGVGFDRIACNRDVRVGEIRHTIYTLGATLVHSVPRTVDVRYESDDYAVTADESNLDVVQEQIRREFDDSRLIVAEMEVIDREGYDFDVDGYPPEEAVDHQRNSIRNAVFDAMDDLNEGDSHYAVGYPLVLLTDD
jgi:hypothetical protein